MNYKFKGIIPALVTPLNQDETVNIPVLHKLLSELLKLKADGFYIGGATGEGICLSLETRKVLTQECVLAVNHQKPCIVHVASVNFNDAIILAKHAEQTGADAVSAIPPLFYSYDCDDIYAYYKKIAESVHIPVMIYYNPAAGFTMNAQIAARLFEIDNITSIKWTRSDYDQMIRLKNLTHGEMNIINGPDEMLLMGLSAGADGGIGTTYNYLLPLIRSIYDNFVNGDIISAQKAQSRVDDIIHVLKCYQVLPSSKVVLERCGFDVGNTVFPMKRYSKLQKDEIMKKLADAGFSADMSFPGKSRE